MDFDDCTVYGFSNDDGTFDFIRVSSELQDLFVKKHAEDLFLSSYEEDNLPGSVAFLLNMGLSKTSVIKNIQIFPNCPDKLAQKIMSELDVAMGETVENEDGILYN